jgi:hypothetical protein
MSHLVNPAQIQQMWHQLKKLAKFEDAIYLVLMLLVKKFLP